MANPLNDALFAPALGRAADFLIRPGRAPISHAAFHDRAARFAAILTGLGLHPGDRIAAQVEKSPDALALYAGAVRAGLVFLPLNPALTLPETEYFLTDSASALLVAGPGDAQRLGPLAKACGAGFLTLGADGLGRSAEAPFAPLPPPVPRRGDDLAALLYTSGTTGRPKGAMLTHDNLLSNARALSDAWRFTDRDVLLHALPIFHTHGLFVATNVTLLGRGGLIFLPGFTPDAVLAALPMATVMMGVPTYYTRLLADPRLTREAAAHLRLFISGSAPLLADTHRDFAARTGHAILERYGMTETSMNASNPYDGPRRAGTVGRPLPGIEIRIADPASGAQLPLGQTGSIEIRGPNVFAGYWRQPEKTRSEFRADGYFITGDLGRFDADGYLAIIGRAKDIIISGGLNIYPGEVEAEIDMLPGVLESAVIGLPHPDWGEAVVAIIAAHPGARPDPQEIAAALAERLAGYKRPKQIILTDSLPRNAMGKVQKALLRQEFRGLFGRPG